MLRVPPRAGAVAVEGGVHRRQHRRMLAHAEIVVGTPDHRRRGPAGMVAHHPGKGAGLAFQLGEGAVAAFPAQNIELFGEAVLVIHSRRPGHCVPIVELCIESSRRAGNPRPDMAPPRVPTSRSRDLPETRSLRE
jgi:hypothetical protein